MTPRRRWKWLAIAGLAVVGLGVAHVPIARMLGGGCPFGRDRALTAEQQAKIRTRATARLRIEGAPASARPAGAFALGVTARAEVAAWAAARGMTCRAGKDRAGLMCAHAGDVETIYADFDRGERLVALSAMTRVDRAETAAARLATAESDLTRALGPATQVSGERSGHYLAARPLRQARAQFRRADYFAQLSATQLGPDRYLVSRTYRALDH